LRSPEGYVFLLSLDRENKVLKKSGDSDLDLAANAACPFLLRMGNEVLKNMSSEMRSGISPGWKKIKLTKLFNRIT
jgi:hypothetical protein